MRHEARDLVAIAYFHGVQAVSYTHLDVYKRQVVGGVVTTHAYGFVEVEFTILQLAHAGQAFTQRIEAVGLGLQFAQACCHGVDFLLRAAAHLLQFGVLLVGPGLQQ